MYSIWMAAGSEGSGSESPPPEKRCMRQSWPLSGHTRQSRPANMAHTRQVRPVSGHIRQSRLANMAHIKKSRPVSGLGFQVKVLDFWFSLGSEGDSQRVNALPGTLARAQQPHLNLRQLVPAPLCEIRTSTRLEHPNRVPSFRAAHVKF